MNTSTNRFSDELIAEAQEISLRDHFSDRSPASGYTIDGTESKDLDDGFDISMRGDCYFLEISIADVASVVTPATRIFAEALARVETRYLALFNIPMIPRVLSENLLSLIPGAPRPAVTYSMLVSANCQVLEFSIAETAFTNKRRLSYSEFDNILKKHPEDPDYEKFSIAAELATKLLAMRRSMGALAIYDIKRGLYTNEEGVVVSTDPSAHYLSHLVIQELMVLTNTTIANYFSEKNLPFLYRNHTARLGAPGRGEILQEITVAMRDGDELAKMQENAVIWFNRAKYSPELSGHFGLNTNAYSHCTSPIRRVADLLNQLLIKSHIRGTTVPFSNFYLQAKSECINRVVWEIKESKASYMKQKAMRISLGQLRKSSEEEMLKMDYSEFEAVAIAAAKNGEMNDQLRTALLLQLEENKIEYYLAYVLLFVAPDDSSEWTEIKELALLYIHKNKGFPNHLLTILESKMGAQVEIEIGSLPNTGKFRSKVTITHAGSVYQPSEYSIRSKKKMATHFAACEAIRLFLGFPDDFFEDASTDIADEFDDSVDLANSSQTEAINPESIDELIRKFRDSANCDLPAGSKTTNNTDTEQQNSVGTLGELVSQREGWQSPEYTYSVEGEAHQPMITCVCSFRSDTVAFRESAVAGSKKIAKQEAAQLVLNALRGKGLIGNGDSSDLPHIPDGDSATHENNVGQLMEFCAKRKIKTPRFSFVSHNSTGDNAFECVVTVRSNGEDHNYSAFARDKKTAKQRAAGLGMKHYFENAKSN